MSPETLVPEGDIMPWSEHFATGFADIDRQHRQLLQQINQLARRLVQGSPLEAEVHNIGLLLGNLDFSATAEALRQLPVPGWAAQPTGQVSVR